MMRVVAVVVAYWPSRMPSIPLIVDELRANTRSPDHIIVFNNNPNVPLPAIAGASVVNAGANYTSRSKYVAALLEPADFYFLLDDDVGAHYDLIRGWLTIAKPDCCYCDAGFLMASKHASSAEIITSLTVEALTPVDLFQGRLQLASFGAILKMLEAEKRIRLPNLPRYRSVGEDHFIALANRGNAFVVPRSIGNYCFDIPKPQGNAAMASDHGYHTIRDEFAYYAWNALGYEALPGDVPGANSDDQKRVRAYLRLNSDRDAGRAPQEMTGDQLAQYEREVWLRS